MNYILWHGVLYILQHSFSYGLAAGAKFCAFSECTHRARQKVTDFFNWQLTVIGTGCLVFSVRTHKQAGQGSRTGGW